MDFNYFGLISLEVSGFQATLIYSCKFQEGNFGQENCQVLIDNPERTRLVKIELEIKGEIMNFASLLKVWP